MCSKQSLTKENCRDSLENCLFYTFDFWKVWKDMRHVRPYDQRTSETLLFKQTFSLGVVMTSCEWMRIEDQRPIWLWRPFIVDLRLWAFRLANKTFAKEKMLHKLSFLVWIVVQKFAHPAVLWKVVNVCLIPPFFFFLMALKRWRQWIEFQMERLKRSRQARCFFNCSNFQFLKFFFSFQSFR